MKLLLVVGTRPNFIKIAPIIRQLKARQLYYKTKSLSWKLVHTGQHYDYDMSKVFFDEIGIDKPDYFLNVGSGTHSKQTADIMIQFERVCLKEEPDIVLVVGDVNSTLACAITSKKLNIKVAHVEAGLRSRDMTMPEEINRIVTDSISDFLFVTEKSGVENLKKEGRHESEIHFVGNVMVDTLYYHLYNIEKKFVSNNFSNICDSNRKYGVVTLHRPSNVDDKNTFLGIIEALIEISLELSLIFPAHPRTMKNIELFGFSEKINKSNIELIKPLSYLEFLNIWKNAFLVFTDSGGLQQETTALGVPCFTIRENTECPITISEGTNRLAGIKKKSILKTYENFKHRKRKQNKIPKYWDGKSAERIVEILLNS